MNEILESLLKQVSGKETTDIYRGTVEPEIMTAFQEIGEQTEAAMEAYKAKRNELWERIYAALSLSPEGKYTLNKITRQVFETIPVEDSEEADSE